MAQALKNPTERIKPVVIAGVKQLSYIIPADRMHHMFDMDIDLAIMDFLRYKEITKSFKGECLAILSNMTAVEDMPKLATVV